MQVKLIGFGLEITVGNNIKTHIFSNICYFKNANEHLYSRLVLDPFIEVSGLRPVEQNPSSLKASRFKNGPRKRSRREIKEEHTEY